MIETRNIETAPGLVFDASVAGLEPEACLSAGVSERIMRGENDHDLHNGILSCKIGVRFRFG
jgi:hypothetical protein